MKKKNKITKGKSTKQISAIILTALEGVGLKKTNGKIKRRAKKLARIINKRK